MPTRPELGRDMLAVEPPGKGSEPRKLPLFGSTLRKALSAGLAAGLVMWRCTGM